MNHHNNSILDFKNHQVIRLYQWMKEVHTDSSVPPNSARIYYLSHSITGADAKLQSSMLLTRSLSMCAFVSARRRTNLRKSNLQLPGQQIQNGPLLV